MKKRIAFLAAIGLALAMFAACAKAPGSQGADASSEALSAAPVEQSAADAEAEENVQQAVEEYVASMDEEAEEGPVSEGTDSDTDTDTDADTIDEDDTDADAADDGEDASDDQSSDEEDHDDEEQNDYEGTYVADGGNGVMLLSFDGARYYAEVTYQEDGGDKLEFTFSGTFDGGVLEYSDCRMEETVITEDGEGDSAESYSGGSGVLEATDGGMNWYDSPGGQFYKKQ